MTSFEADSNAAAVAQALAQAAGALSNLEDANAAAGDIVADARQPVKSGRLAASVRAEPFPGGVSVAGLVRYWSFVEWGAPRANVVAQHPLRSQVQTREADIIAVYTEHAATVVATIGE